MSSVRTTNSSLSRNMPSPPLSLSSSSLSPAMAAFVCFLAKCRAVIWGAGASSGVGGDGGESWGISAGGGGGGEEDGGGVEDGGRVVGGGDGDGSEGGRGLGGRDCC